MSEDIFMLMNSKDAEEIEADAWNEIVPEISSLLSITDDEVYDKLSMKQAVISGNINTMFKIASLIKDRRHS
jgi:hypothetical protein